MQIRGGWGKGLDRQIPLFSNTDQYVIPDEDIFVLHLYYYQEFFEDQLQFRIGKFDIGDWIDTNRYGYYNWLGYSFAHTQTIPLTGNTNGLMATFAPKDAGWYVSGGFSNATQTPTEAGLDSTFDSSTDWLSIAEIGFKPKFGDREGVYRFIGYHNGKDFTTSSGTTESGAQGGAVSFDQDLTDQLGVFFRFGINDGDPLEPWRYYSGGVYIKEPIAGRKLDSLALGVVVNEFTSERKDSLPNGTSTENYFELYYNWVLFRWCEIQPVLQVVDNPNGQDEDTAIILGVHVHLAL